MAVYLKRLLAFSLFRFTLFIGVKMEEGSRFILYFVLFTIIVGHVCSQGKSDFFVV